MDTALPANTTLNQLAVSADGSLYATSTLAVNATATKGGIERSLNPYYAQGPTFETVIRGLDDGATLSGLWFQGNQLWALDTTNTKLVTFADSLAKPVTLSSPADNATGFATENVILKWAVLGGATEYKWQLDYDTDFSAVPSGFEGTTQTSSVRLPILDSDTKYYWQVRATKPYLSRWSDACSFTTGLGQAVDAPELLSPKAGAEGVSLKPLFQWTAIAGAGSYEFVMATDVFFNKPVITKTGNDSLPATAWRHDINLDFDTTYYWKVRASSPGSQSPWSAVGAFITQPPPPATPTTTVVTTPVQPQTPTITPQTVAPSPPPPPPVPPPAVPQNGLPDWFPMVTGGLLFAIVVLLITILVLVVTIRRR